MSEKKELKISGIIQDLDNGLSRKEIAAKYGISLFELKVHFEHPKLKGKKPKKQFVAAFALVDDLEVAENQLSLTEELGADDDIHVAVNVEDANVEKGIASPFPQQVDFQ